jgi:hypothetical protein
MLVGLGMLVKDARVFFRGDYHIQPYLHFGIVEHVTSLRSHFNFNLFLKWEGCHDCNLGLTSKARLAKLQVESEA